MSDDRISITVAANTADYEAAIERAANKLVEFQQLEKATIEVLKTFGKSLDGSVSPEYAVKLSGISQEGLKINQSFKLLDGTLQQVSEKLKKLDSPNLGNKKVAALTGRIEGNVTPLADKIDPKQQTAYNVAKAQLDELVRKHQSSYREIKEVWRNLEIGKAQKIDDLGLAQLQRKMQEVIALRDKMTNPNLSGANAFQKIIDDAKAAELKMLETAHRINDLRDTKAGKASANAFQKIIDDAKAAELKMLETAHRINDAFNASLSARKQVSPLIDVLQPGRNAAPDTVINLAAAKNKLVDFLAENKAVQGQVQKIWADVANGSINQYSGKLEQLQKLIFALRIAHAETGHAAGSSLDAALRQSKDLAGHLDSQQEKVRQLTFSWQTMFRLVISQAASRAISGMTHELSLAVDESLKLSKQLAAITTVDKTGLNSDAWQTSLRKLNEESGLGMVDTAKAAYQALSNQVGEGAQNLRFLKEANDLAIVGLSTSTQAVDLLSSAINSYGLDISEAHDLAAKFFKVVELGRVTIPEMSESLGRLAPLAAQVGVSFDEMGAAIDVITMKGVKYEVASTFLRNVLSKLAKPTEDMANWFHELGYASGEALISAIGFGGFLSELEKKAHGSSTEIATLFKDIRAISGATMFAGQSMALYEKDLAAITDATSTYDAQVQKLKDTIGHDWDVAGEKIKDIFSLDTMSPFITSIAEATNNFEYFVDVISAARPALIGIATGALVPIVVGAGSALKALFALATLSFNPVVVGLTLVAAAIGVIAASTSSVEAGNRRLFIEWQEGYQKTAEAAHDAAVEAQRDAERTYDNAMKPFRQLIAEKQKLINADLERQKTVRESLKVAVDASKDFELGAMQAVVDASKQKARSLKTDIDSIKAAAENALNELNALKQAQDLAGKAPSEKIPVLDRNIGDLTGARQAAADRGDIDKFKAVSKELDSVLQERKRLIESSLNETGDLLGKYKKALDDSADAISEKGREPWSEQGAQEYNKLLAERERLTRELAAAQRAVRENPLDHDKAVASIRKPTDGTQESPLLTAERRLSLAREETRERLNSSDILQKANAQEIKSKEEEQALLVKMGKLKSTDAAATEQALVKQTALLDSTKKTYEGINAELAKKSQTLKEQVESLSVILGLTQEISKATGHEQPSIENPVRDLQNSNLGASDQAKAVEDWQKNERSISESVKSANNALKEVESANAAYASKMRNLASEIRPGLAFADKVRGLVGVSPKEDLVAPDKAAKTFDNTGVELARAARALETLADTKTLNAGKVAGAKDALGDLKPKDGGDSDLKKQISDILNKSLADLQKSEKDLQKAKHEADEANARMKEAVSKLPAIPDEARKSLDEQVARSLTESIDSNTQAARKLTETIPNLRRAESESPGAKAPPQEVHHNNYTANIQAQEIDANAILRHFDYLNKTNRSNK